MVLNDPAIYGHFDMCHGHFGYRWVKVFLATVMEYAQNGSNKKDLDLKQTLLVWIGWKLVIWPILEKLHVYLASHLSTSGGYHFGWLLAAVQIHPPVVST